MVTVTAQTAQKKVTKLLLDQVGNLLFGERPNLVSGERSLWRVPVWLSYPTIGPLGQVGTLDVDAETGEILYTQQLLEEIADRGNALGNFDKKPVIELADEIVLTLAEIKMDRVQNDRLGWLQAKGKREGLTKEEQSDLNNLMQIIQKGQLRKSEALAEAVRRGLREPLAKS